MRAARYLLLIVTLSLMVVLIAVSQARVGMALPPSEPPDNQTLSPFWPPQIARWGDYIVRSSAPRGLDPDLVAAIIRAESRGIPDAISPAGATGLMQIMPAEMGFPWRPTMRTLLNPAINVDWGAAILASTLEDGQGDLFASLAAYNGGWGNVNDPDVQAYALWVANLYAMAVAARNGYRPEDALQWGMVVEVRGREDVRFARNVAPGRLLTTDIVGPRITPGQSVISAVPYNSRANDQRPWRILVWLLAGNHSE